MKVKECMGQYPEYVHPQTTLQEAAEIMRSHDFGFLPIGDGNKLIGVLTDRDIVTRAIAKGLNTAKSTVQEAMTRKILYCFEDDDIQNACKMMGEQQVRRLVVLDKQKQMTGVLTFHDIALNAHNDALCGHVLEEVTADIRRAA